jgi:hypothetical protein
MGGIFKAAAIYGKYLSANIESGVLRSRAQRVNARDDNGNGMALATLDIEAESVCSTRQSNGIYRHWSAPTLLRKPRSTWMRFARKWVQRSEAILVCTALEN